jgi:hypothetical protein
MPSVSKTASEIAAGIGAISTIALGWLVYYKTHCKTHCGRAKHVDTQQEKKECDDNARLEPEQEQRDRYAQRDEHKHGHEHGPEHDSNAPTPTAAAKPTATEPVLSHADLVEFLVEKAPGAQVAYLNMRGRNKVVYRRGGACT